MGVKKYVLIVVLFACFGFSLAQKALYAAEPPANSSFVRFIDAATAAQSVSVSVDDVLRLKSVAFSTASDYLILKAGKHSLELRAGDAVVKTELLVVANKFYSGLVTGLAEKPVFVEDKTPSNKLKALLNVYHLAPKFGNVDVLAGGAKVFSNLAPNTSKSLQVNPVSAEVEIVKAGSAELLTKAKFTLINNAAYSLLIYPKGSGMDARVVQNLTEPVEGK